MKYIFLKIIFSIFLFFGFSYITFGFLPNLDFEAWIKVPSMILSSFLFTAIGSIMWGVGQ